MEGAIDAIGPRRHLSEATGSVRATADKTGTPYHRHTTDAIGFGPDIRRDERTNHLDKLNIGGAGMRLGYRRLSIIRRRDNASHYDR